MLSTWFAGDVVINTLNSICSRSSIIAPARKVVAILEYQARASCHQSWVPIVTQDTHPPGQLCLVSPLKLCMAWQQKVDPYLEAKMIPDETYIP